MGNTIQSRYPATPPGSEEFEHICDRCGVRVKVILTKTGTDYLHGFFYYPEIEIRPYAYHDGKYKVYETDERYYLCPICIKQYEKEVADLSFKFNKRIKDFLKPLTT